jgi:hypothetical protein
MNKLFAGAITVLTSLAIPNAAVAAIINGSFGDEFNNWQTIGDYTAQTSAFRSGTLDRNFQAFLSTAYDEVISVDSSGAEIRGGNAAPATFITGIAED